MKRNDVPVDITDWSTFPATVENGVEGIATVRTRKLGDVQMRLVDYSPHYVAADWCSNGHIVYVVAGEIAILLKNAIERKLCRGMSFHVTDNLPHRVTASDKGATIFVVDGVSLND